jgi:RsiW-degrading membrane proteinase PrsW (M82 family)
VAASVLRPLQRPFVQVREPSFWVFVALLVAGAITTLRTLAGLSDVSRSGWALAWFLLAIYALPIVVLVYRLDLYEREPIAFGIAAFGWGALAAPGLAIDAAGWNGSIAGAIGADATALWLHPVWTPLVEEVLKGAGVVLLALIARDGFDDMMDGFVYGALVGLGFAVVEDVIYFMAVFGGTPSGVLQGFSLRVLATGLYGHVLYTSLVGMGVGYLVTTRGDASRGRRVAVAVGFAAAAILAHIAWNLPALNPVLPEGMAGTVLWPLLLMVKGVPLLVFVALAVRMAHRRERRWLDEALASEVGLDGISADEMATLRDPRRRRRATTRMRARAGRRAAALLQRLQREQVNLAMIASKAPEDLATIAVYRARCRSLRLAIAAIPGAASAEVGA